MAPVKISGTIYLVLGVVGLAVAVLVPVVIYRSGTSALPSWAKIAIPGPLSAAHTFLEAQCESCHTPNVGIQAASCITCHAPDAFALGTPATAFHATIQECRGCHIEHQGRDVRPKKIDHSVLVAVALQANPAQTTSGPPGPSGIAALLRSLGVARGKESVSESSVLDCASCHGFRDKHQAMFGQQCADCHALETWKVAGYLHPSPKSQDCNQCHQAPRTHFMMHFGMVDQGITGRSRARVDQCYFCHQTDSFNNIKGVGWFKMH